MPHPPPSPGNPISGNSKYYYCYHDTQTQRERERGAAAVRQTQETRVGPARTREIQRKDERQVSSAAEQSSSSSATGHRVAAAGVKRSRDSFFHGPHKAPTCATWYQGCCQMMNVSAKKKLLETNGCGEALGGATPFCREVGRCPTILCNARVLGEEKQSVVWLGGKTQRGTRRDEVGLSCRPRVRSKRLAGACPN